MVFIALDIETTGLDRVNNQIIEFGAVFVDTKIHPSNWNVMHVIIDHGTYTGSAYAIALNARIFSYLKDYESHKPTTEHYVVIEPEALLPMFCDFIEENGIDPKDMVYDITVAGKNAAGFDIPFLQEHFKKHNSTLFKGIGDHRRRSAMTINFNPRVIDPAILYTDFNKDKGPLSLSACKKAAGLDEYVSHNASEDAMDVVLLLAVKMGFDLADALTNEYLDDTYKKLVDNNFSPKHNIWVIDDEYTIAARNDKHPFRGYAIKKGFDEPVIIWSKQELYNIINRT